MTDLFLKTVNMSLTAVFLILAVILLRLIFKKAPKWISCLLWAIVAIRLLVPFTLESPMSLLPTAEPVKTYAQTSEPYIESGVKVIDTAANKIISKPVPATPKKEKTTVKSTTQKTTVKRSWNAIDLLSVIWISGIAVMLIYALISYLRLRKAVFAAVKISDRVWICDEIDTPFILGIFNPRIYIPSGLNGDARKYVLEHEHAHLARFDHIWKPLSFIVLAIHWFNPMCWIAYILFGRDVELACDEKAVKDMSKEDKIGYTTTLLNLSCPKLISACPLAYAEIGVKKRVKSILNYKKPAFWLIAAAVISSIALSGCFMTNRPAKSAETTETSASESTVETTAADVTNINAKPAETGETSANENTTETTVEGVTNTTAKDAEVEKELTMRRMKNEPIPDDILNIISDYPYTIAGGHYPGPENIKKIISLDPSITWDLVRMGAGDRIIGVDPKSATIRGLRSDVTIFYDDYDNTDSIIRALPDIIFDSGRTYDYMYSIDLKSLEGTGICLVDIPPYTSIHQIAEFYRFIGALIGESTRAEENAEEIERYLSEVKALGKSIKEEDKKNLVFIGGYDSESGNIYLTYDEIFKEIADLIGANYSPEKLEDGKCEKYMIDTDPDLIFYDYWDIYEPLDKAITSNKKLKNVKAVKNHEFHYINDPLNSDQQIFGGLYGNYTALITIQTIMLRTYPEQYTDSGLTYPDIGGELFGGS